MAHLGNPDSVLSVGAAIIVDVLDETTEPEIRGRIFRLAAIRWYEMQPIFRRASHLMECAECGKLYIAHPRDASYPYLKKLCSGDLVKL